ncbi:MAG: FHA domain-containing protein [Burkholderiales bacterium]|nr:FHA domain-containing protein [Burkholderiales bacterium]
MDRPEDRLALIELQERDGRVQRTLDVHHWPLTLGRALDNTLVLDDPHVAPAHASVAPGEDGQLLLSVGHTANGVLLDGRPLAAGACVPLPPAGAHLQLGTTRLRLRLRGEALAAERPLRQPGTRPRVVALQAAALMLLVTAGHWIALDPGADFTAWLPLLFGAPLGVVAWCGAWALLSKLFQHRFEFWGHLCRVLPWLLAMELTESLLPTVAASLAWPWLWQLSVPAVAALGALLLHSHLRYVLPQHGRVVSFAVVAMTLVFGAVSLATVYRNTDSLARSPYMSTLPMSGLRLGGTVPVPALVAAMAPLEARLAARVKQAREEDAADSADADE